MIFDSMGTSNLTSAIYIIVDYTTTILNENCNNIEIVCVVRSLRFCWFLRFFGCRSRWFKRLVLLWFWVLWNAVYVEGFAGISDKIE